MANDYFNHVTNVIPAGVRALASQVNNIATEISTGLDLLPTEVQLKRGLTRFAVDTGAADAYVVTLPYTPALVDGLEVSFRPINNNTGASTINVNALGAKAIVLYDLTTLDANAIVANSMVTVRYSQPGDHFVLMTGAAAVQSVNDATTLDGLDSTQFLRSDVADTYTSGAVGSDGLTISETTLTSGRALRVSSNNAGQVGFVATIEELNAGAAGGALQLRHLGTGPALDVSRSSSGLGIFVGHTGASGVALDINAGGTSSSVDILNSSTSSSAATVNIAATDGGNSGALLNLNATHGGKALNVIQNGASPEIAIDVAQSTAEKGINISHTGTNGVALDVNANNASRTFDVVSIVQDHITPGSGVRALYVQQDGTGPAARFYSNLASRATPLVEVVNDNATGAGVALQVTQDQAGTALQLTSNLTSAADGLHVRHFHTAVHKAVFIEDDGIAASLEILHNGTVGDGIYSNVIGAGAYAGRFYSNTATRLVAVLEVVNDNATGTGVALSVTNDQTGHAIEAITTTADGRAGHFSRNVTTPTVPVVDIVNDHPSGSGDIGALRVQQDAAHPHIDLAGTAGEGIRFTRKSVADPDTLGAYEHGTFTVTFSALGSGTVTVNTTEDTLGYVRIGRMVFIHGWVGITSVSAPTGTIRMAGLPFTSVTTGPENSEISKGTINGENFSSAITGVLTAQVIGTNVDFKQSDGTTDADIDTKIQAGTDFYFNLCYISDAV